ncbi:MAG: phage holin family protein [Candidatus Gastranaerophilaceae bacterium]|jgi:hypothetical protein|uniref:Phage holin family protein n=1 Tax=Candidatus Limenecus avicola TaxID=2840847 RepID=A0A9D1N170_9CLOT|nr:phage holin family protein [Clostridium sp.]HIU92869.1 phage holin family protein [Candidatus Limenecus avicola]
MILVRWICFALALIFTAWVIPGIEVSSFLSAMFACVIIALINTFVKPVLQLVTLPINFLTVGLFSFVLNALLLMLAGWITPGLEVDGFLSALLGSIVLSIFSVGISKI